MMWRGPAWTQWWRTGLAWAAGGPRGGRKLTLLRDHQRGILFLNAGQPTAYARAYHQRSSIEFLQVGQPIAQGQGIEYGTPAIPTHGVRAVCSPIPRCWVNIQLCERRDESLLAGPVTEPEGCVYFGGVCICAPIACSTVKARSLHAWVGRCAEGGVHGHMPSASVKHTQNGALNQ